MVDTRGSAAAPPGRCLAQLARTAGAQLRRPGQDLGKEHRGIRFPEESTRGSSGSGSSLAGPEAGVVYAGTEPGAMFRSTDGGETFSLVQALWDHPHRAEWGAGFGGQAFHTCSRTPRRPSVTAAISTGGVYRTTDGGAVVVPRAIRASARTSCPRAQQYPEFGQCVHKVTRHPSHPDRLYLQNHGGVYRSDDEGGSWQSIADGLVLGLRVPGRRTPARARHDLRLPGRAARAGTRPRASPGSGARATRATPGSRCTRACPRSSTSG